MEGAGKNRPAPPRVIAVTTFDGISPFHLAVPCVVFGDVHPGAPAFAFRVCAGEPGPLRTTAGFAVATHHGLEAVAEADMVIVPSWRDPEEAPPPALLEALRQAHQRGAVIVGLCLGAYVLAGAGLLDGFWEGGRRRQVSRWVGWMVWVGARGRRGTHRSDERTP